MNGAIPSGLQQEQMKSIKKAILKQKQKKKM
jgi:hypothetical protein